MPERSFAPTVLIDGVTLTPEGWMWILSFALAGIPWAVRAAMKPEFDLRSYITEYNRRKRHRTSRTRFSFDKDHQQEQIENRRSEIEACAYQAKLNVVIFYSGPLFYGRSIVGRVMRASGNLERWDRS